MSDYLLKIARRSNADAHLSTGRAPIRPASAPETSALPAATDPLDLDIPTGIEDAPANHPTHLTTTSHPTTPVAQPNPAPFPDPLSARSASRPPQSAFPPVPPTTGDGSPASPPPHNLVPAPPHSPAEPARDRQPADTATPAVRPDPPGTTRISIPASNRRDIDTNKKDDPLAATSRNPTITPTRNPSTAPASPGHPALTAQTSPALNFNPPPPSDRPDPGRQRALSGPSLSIGRISVEVLPPPKAQPQPTIIQQVAPAPPQDNPAPHKLSFGLGQL